MTEKNLKIWAALAALALPLVCSAQRSPTPAAASKALASIDHVIEQALREQKVPGVAVGVVVADRVVLLKGYGWRDLDQRLPMTPDTLIPIASVTKQFTVAAVGTFVRQGKLDWDQPIRNYLPEFRLADDVATLRATPRDLVTHRIGLSRHDALWFGTQLTREQLYGRLQYLGFSRDLRVRFQYNNLMYMTAGYLAGRLAGGTWEEVLRTSILEPLRMARSGFSLRAVEADSDHASAYQLDESGQLIADRHEAAEVIGPAGSIDSTARDLVNYLQMMLAEGTFEGRRILDAADVKAMMQPQIPVSESLMPEFGFTSYGMGLFVRTYRGVQTAQHGGDLPGAATMVLMLPRERIGIAVLCNRSGATLRDGLPYEIVDRLLGLRSAGLIARFAEMERKALAGTQAATRVGASERTAGTHPAHELAAYAGRYTHPAYGLVTIQDANDRLTLGYNGFSTPLEHWHYEVFRAPNDRTNRLEQSRVQFVTDLEGEVSSVAIPLDPNVEPVVFRRAPPREMLEQTFLQQLVGTYDIGGIDVDVVLREHGVLQLVILGRSSDLVPVRGTLFRVSDMSGVTVEFLRDDAGKVDRIGYYAGENTIGPRKQ